MAKNRVLYGLYLLAVLVFHSFYTGWFSFFLLIFSVILPAFSLLLSLPAMLRARFDAQLPARCACTQEAEYRLRPVTQTRLPLPCCRLRLTVSDVVGGSEQTQWIPLGGTLTFSMRVDTRHAGVCRFTVDRARVCDALGLVSIPVRLPPVCAIAVEPEPQAPLDRPNLSQFQYRSYHPKPGGGFSEIHDLREYRPGDSLRDIHWKLSAKTDKLIVREAQEPDRRYVLLTLDLGAEREHADRTLGVLLWVSRWLLEHETAHFVCWLSPEALDPVTMPVSDTAELEALIEKLLDTPLRGGMPSIAGRSFAAADWRYHIRLPGEVPV